MKMKDLYPFTFETELAKNSLGREITIYLIKGGGITVAETRFPSVAPLITDALNSSVEAEQDPEEPENQG